MKNIEKFSLHLSDLATKIRYRSYTPQKYQKIFVKPAEVRREPDWDDPRIQKDLLGPGFMHYPRPEKAARSKLRGSSKLVQPGIWDQHTVPVTTHPTATMVHKKIAGNISWEEAGAYAWMKAKIEKHGQHDGCKTMEDVAGRYGTLTRIEAFVRSKGYLLSQKDVDSSAFREHGGISIGIGRNGEFLFLGKGRHRLAIAQYFQIDEIPACLCAVHPMALEKI